MRKRAVLYVLVLSMVMSISLSGCSVGSATPLESVRESLESFSIRLPRMYVVYDESGDPSVFGLKASTIEGMLEPLMGPNSLWMLKIHPYYMDWIGKAQLQHVEAVWDTDGIFLFVNGEAMPHIAWDADSLDYAGQMAQIFGAPYGALIRRIVPLLGRLGVDILVQMPVPDGAAALPYRNTKGSLMQTAVNTAPIADPTATIHLEVNYDESGNPSLAGISANDVAALTGADSLYMTRLTPAVIDGLKGANIQYLAVVTQADGLHILVNGHTLPYVAWDEAHLNAALNLYLQSNAPSDYIGMMGESVRQISRTDLRVVVRFPLAEGVEAIDLP